MEAVNLPDTELKAMAIRLLKKLRGIINKLSENLNRDSKHKKEHKNH